MSFAVEGGSAEEHDAAWLEGPQADGGAFAEHEHGAGAVALAAGGDGTLGDVGGSLGVLRGDLEVAALIEAGFDVEQRGEHADGRRHSEGAAGDHAEAGALELELWDVGCGDVLEGGLALLVRGGQRYPELEAVDVGAGILLGDLGVYVATPVADRYGRGGLNFFIRLAPRF